MISRDSFWKAYIHEFNCIRHLANKVTPEMLAYRPTPGQRSLLELLQYLSYASAASMYALVHETLDDYGVRNTAAKNVTLDNFAETMHEQQAEMYALITRLSDAQMDQEYDLWGVMTKAEHLLRQLQMVTAYKMQLFLYIKAAGNTAIGTMDLWSGMDTPPKVD